MVFTTSFLASDFVKKHYAGLSFSVWQGIIISLIESTLVSICYFLSIYFVNELHVNITSAGIIMSCYGLGTIVGGLSGGKLSDHISPGIVSIIGLLLQSIAYFALMKARVVSFLMIDLFIMGVGSYIFITSNHVWVLARCQSSENQRLKAINILGVASNIGIGLSSIIISLVITTGSFTSVFALSGFLLFVMAVYLIVKEKDETFPSMHRHAQVIKSTHVPPRKDNISKNNIKITWYVLGCLFATGIVISQMSSTYSVYLQEIFPEMGVKSFGILFALNAFIVVLFQSPVVNFFSNHNKILVVGVGAFILALGMLLLNFAYYYLLAIVACIVMTLGEMVFFSVSQLVCYEKADAQNKGRSLGIYRMIYATSRFVGPLIGGIIYQGLGGSMVWYLCGLLGLLCLLPSTYLYKYD